MYLNEIWIENVGPLEHCHIELPFSGTGDPVPVVIVGPNGSGKSIFLSYVIDALFEFGKPVFRDIATKNFQNPNPYFRLMGGTTVRSGKPFSLSLLLFKSNDQTFKYVEKVGTLDPATYAPHIKSKFSTVWNWPVTGPHKSRESNNGLIESAFQKGCFCYFPANRHEAPHWLNENSLNHPMPWQKSDIYTGMLGKPLYVENSGKAISSWILDVLLDSLIDLPMVSRAAASSEEDRLEIRHRYLLRKARQNIEIVLQEVLQDPKCELQLRFRGASPSRVGIKLSNGNTIPGLESLSAGQSILLNLFASIIRYADFGDINSSINLHEITGIVLIDEIDAHLHTVLQHDSLPRLIKLFPRVQFIVSSHSPLFLLGMESTFGSNGFGIYEMPIGQSITTERFAEFQTSFDRYKVTKKFEEEVKIRAEVHDKPLVLTEGVLDPKYIITALKLLGYQTIVDSINIEFVGLDESNGSKHGGKDGLNHFRNVTEANPWLLKRAILLLYDCDTNKSSEDIGLLHIRSIPRNTRESKATVGIENLFDKKLFEQRFYRRIEKEGPYGERKILEEFDKVDFCRWLCDERQNPEDFRGFEPVAEILKEFVGQQGQ